MSKSLKVTRILLVAAFAAGLSACSSESDPSGVSVAPTVTVTVSQSASGSAEPEASPSTLPALPSASASPHPSDPSQIRGVDAEVLGQVNLLGANSIKVDPEKGDSREALLTPYTVVLDVQGAICSQGKLPHKCSVEQMVKALKSGNSLYALVTIKDGVATEIEEIVGE